MAIPKSQQRALMSRKKPSKQQRLLEALSKARGSAAGAERHPFARLSDLFLGLVLCAVQIRRPAALGLRALDKPDRHHDAFQASIAASSVPTDLK